MRFAESQIRTTTRPLSAVRVGSVSDARWRGVRRGMAKIPKSSVNPTVIPDAKYIDSTRVHEMQQRSR